MVEVLLGMEKKAVDRPYLVHIYGVDEDAYDCRVDEDEKADLIDGVMIVQSPGSRRHEKFFVRLVSLMAYYAEHRALGEVLGSKMTIHVAPCRKLEPDIIFVRASRLSLFQRTQLEGPPDLAVEILSPSTRSYDLGQKRAVYRQAGVEEIWFVNPDRPEIIIDRKEGEEYREEIITEGVLHCNVLPGFHLPLEWLYADPPPDPVECLRQLLEGGL